MKFYKRNSQWFRGYYSYMLRLLYEIRDTKLSHLSKDKKEIKKFVLRFALKFVINISCFGGEARVCLLEFILI